MIYASSDIHGYPLDRFLRLLEKAGFGEGDTLWILGDVVDRNGDGGVAMLRWIQSAPNVRMLLGNHEAMLLACESLFENLEEERTEPNSYSQQSITAFTVGDLVEHLFRDGLDECGIDLDGFTQQWLTDIELLNLKSTGLRTFNLTLSFYKDAVLLTAFCSLL